MAGEGTVLGDGADKREQPFLYSWNRRVRHLHGISLRNLNIAPPSAHKAKGKTSTDDDYNLTTPARLIARDERNVLHASRSFSDLVKDSASAPPSKTELKKAVTLHSKYDTAIAGVRPGGGKLRRRSTLHWAGASPRVRQQKLEGVAVDRMVDTWFSIHHPDSEEPVYISEVMHKSMNPSFSNFDLDAAAASVARSDTFQIKIWTKNTHMLGYKLLIDMSVHLRSLQFVGKTLETFHHPLPENCVVFHLIDGMYTAFTDLPAEEVHEPQLKGNQKSMLPIRCSSYDALMKLANLDDCIQDALRTREKLEADINTLLNQHKQDLPIAHTEAQREKVRVTKKVRDSQRREVQRLSKLKTDLETSRDDRKKAMQRAIRGKEDMASIPDKLGKSIQAVQGDLDTLEESSRGQIRRVCESLLTIFPIEPIKNRALQFTIRGIHLPNSVFDDTNRDEIAAALGFTAQSVYQLSMYLSIPLPYEIEANASSSSITDMISVSLTQRKFPLFPTNVNYKFEYGVFLLNKNIEFLMNRVGLRVLDIRHTLPNLKYLLFVLTAGTGEIPARKVGAVRGLLAGATTLSSSRRSSDDSGHSRSRSRDYASGNGSISNALGEAREKSPDTHDPFVGPGRVKGLPYRRSLLRDIR